MQLWTNSTGGCWNACLASLVDCHPADVPYDDDDVLDLDRLNRWLAPRGRRLEPVYGRYVTDCPSGLWIALEGRSPSMAHAVLALGAKAIHDPAGGPPLHLWSNLAARTYPNVPLGYRLR